MKLFSGRRPLIVAAFGAVIAAALVVAQSSQATPRAPEPSCGATITVSTKLDRDLVNCPNNGITIGADKVMLDLNGHAIDGDGSEFPGCPPDQPCDVGLVDLDHHGVTIKGGRVREFALGALLVGAADTRLTFASGTIVKVAVDVSGEPFVDLATEAKMAFARD